MIERVLKEENSLKMKGVIESLKSFLESLTTGKRLTLAQFLRKEITKHPEYKKDSILSKKLMDEIIMLVW